jgi:hypothetical protein
MTEQIVLPFTTDVRMTVCPWLGAAFPERFRPSYPDKTAGIARALIQAAAVVLCITLLAPGANAQTNQRWSIQGSVIWTDLFGDQFEPLKAGTGGEAQLRYTTGAWSWGAGLQYTVHGDSEAEADGHDANIKLIGFFVEPRYVINVGSSKWAPYLGARAAFAQFDVRVDFSTGDVNTFKSDGLTLNGGGGILINLSSRTNLDIGATIGYSNYKDANAMNSETGPFIEPLGSGMNAVVRLGLAIGLGK